jgi:transposase
MMFNRFDVALVKNVFQLYDADHRDKAVWKHWLSRGKWLVMLYDMVESRIEIGMEACAGAHCWARQLIERGYEIKIVTCSL